MNIVLAMALLMALVSCSPDKEGGEATLPNTGIPPLSKGTSDPVDGSEGGTTEDPSTAGTSVSTIPTVTSRSPANLASDVAAYIDVSVTFSQAMDASTVTSSSFKLMTGLSVVVPGTVSYDSSTMTARFRANSRLVSGQNYTVLLTSDLKDQEGNALAGDSSTFTVGTPGWTWVSGNNGATTTSVYGSKGVAASTNIPSGRMWHDSWIAADGSFILYSGYDSGTKLETWRFDGTNWTWIRGVNTGALTFGTYGSKNVAASTNEPGSRRYPAVVKGRNGIVYLYGGDDLVGGPHAFNDLWRWVGTYWTWISGPNTSNTAAAVYGTLNTANSANKPGSRIQASLAVDASGNLWLFGGYGADSAGTKGSLNDLWKWDGANWTWISGSNIVNQTAVYGTKKVAASANHPGARADQKMWIDSAGKIWIFGGAGTPGTANASLSDLWSFDGTNWTWVAGPSSAAVPGTYGTKGVANASNNPGARYGSASAQDSDGNIWLFGGMGIDNNLSTARHNDLWRWDGENWTWMSGSQSSGDPAVFGTKGTKDTTNTPSNLSNHSLAIDASNNLWLYGGTVTVSGGSINSATLWKYTP